MKMLGTMQQSVFLDELKKKKKKTTRKFPFWVTALLWLLVLHGTHSVLHKKLKPVTPI